MQETLATVCAKYSFGDAAIYFAPSIPNKKAFGAFGSYVDKETNIDNNVFLIDDTVF